MAAIYGVAKKLNFQPTPNESFFLNRMLVTGRGYLPVGFEGAPRNVTEVVRTLALPRLQNRPDDRASSSAMCWRRPVRRP